MTASLVAALLSELDDPGGWTDAARVDDVELPCRLALVGAGGRRLLVLLPDQSRNLLAIALPGADTALDLDLGDGFDRRTLEAIIGSAIAGDVSVFVRSWRRRRAVVKLRCGSEEVRCSISPLARLMPGRWESLPRAVAVAAGPAAE